MKKFEFSLNHMLDYKSRILDTEQGLLLRLKGEQAQIQQKIDSLNAEFQKISLYMHQAQEKGTTVLEVRRFSMQLDNIRLQRKELQEALQKAAKKVEKQTTVVLAANQEVSKLDKLQDKQFEDYRYRAEKIEELQIEELVTLGLSRKSAG